MASTALGFLLLFGGPCSLSYPCALCKGPELNLPLCLSSGAAAELWALRGGQWAVLRPRSPYTDWRAGGDEGEGVMTWAASHLG